MHEVAHWVPLHVDGTVHVPPLQVEPLPPQSMSAQQTAEEQVQVFAPFV
jgi:hypothetical protein